MKILLHICCGPCTIYPLRIMRDMGHVLTGYYFNPNVHPYQEYMRRVETLANFAEKSGLPIIWAEDYDMESFFRLVAGHEEDRCRLCYLLRLRKTAQAAKIGGYDAFTTTLLYSKFQKHELIHDLGVELSQAEGLPFHYLDFRPGWQEGVRLSREWGMYRQPYCGCLYSEKERHFRHDNQKT